MASRMVLNTFAGACGCTGCGGRRLRQHRRSAARECSGGPVAWAHPGQIADVVIFTEFGDVRRRAGTHLDDWRSTGRGCGAVGPYAAGNTGTLGADGHGGDALGRAGCTAYGDSLFAGADSCFACRASARAGLHCVLSCDFISDAALNSYGEPEPPRISFVARIWC